MYIIGVPFLKEPYDEDTAVLGQFCAKVITSAAFTNTQNGPCPGGGGHLSIF